MRTILVLTAGLSAALFGLAASESEETVEEWVERSPLRTRGCPGLALQVERWQRWLKMPAWTVESRCGLADLPLPDHYGLSWTRPEQRRATIWVREGLNTAWQNRVVLHELLHVGIAAGRWTVPAGRREEDFVVEKTEAFLDGDF